MVFDVFISCEKCQNTLQLNTCVKYCTKDQRNGMSKTSQIHCTDFNALNAMYVKDVRDGICGFYATLYAEYRFHVEDVKDTLYSVYSGPSPCQEGRLVVAIRSVGLAFHHHAVRGGSFVFKCSGTCQTTRVIAGKMHSQSQILKFYGGAQQPSNSYETMTKLHPPHSNRTCQKQFRI